MQRWYKLLIACGLLVAVIIYALFDPAESGLFPKCPFLQLTGLLCPGCGSQRALHSLLVGDIKAAFHYNPLATLLFPYLILGFVVELLLYSKSGTSGSSNAILLWLRKFLFGRAAAYIILVAVLLFWGGRNIL